MEPFQIYTAVCLAILLIVRFFQGDDYDVIESEDVSNLNDLNVLSSAFGTIWQLED
jgi:hypothetical protein